MDQSLDALRSQLSILNSPDSVSHCFSLDIMVTDHVGLGWWQDPWASRQVSCMENACIHDTQSRQQLPTYWIGVCKGTSCMWCAPDSNCQLGKRLQKAESSTTNHGYLKVSLFLMNDTVTKSCVGIRQLSTTPRWKPMPNTKSINCISVSIQHFQSWATWWSANHFYWKRMKLIKGNCMITGMVWKL